MPKIIVSAFLMAASLLLVTPASAFYNANLTGAIVHLLTYDDGRILIKLNNQPTSNGECNAAFFAIDPALDSAIVSRLYARLTLAYTQQTSITIGYDNAGNCVNNYIRVHRVG